MVVAVSCTPIRETSGGGDEYYSTAPRPAAPSRIYVDDPYAGTVVLERDPYTGRYYQVSPNAYRSSPYGRYNNGYDPYYNDRYYRNDGYYRNNRTYRNNTNSQANQQQQEARQQQEKRRQEARESVRKPQ